MLSKFWRKSQRKETSLYAFLERQRRRFTNLHFERRKNSEDLI
jgi:hypothetical protein